jgi:hypothetical protein
VRRVGLSSYTLVKARGAERRSKSACGRRQSRSIGTRRRKSIGARWSKMERHRRRLTVAPAAVSPTSVWLDGSRFSCLGSKSSGSEINEEDLPAQVALDVLDGKVEDGWTPVCRRKTPEAGAVADL